MSGFGSEHCNGVTEDGCSYGTDYVSDRSPSESEGEPLIPSNNSFTEFVEGSMDNT